MLNTNHPIVLGHIARSQIKKSKGTVFTRVDKGIALASYFRVYTDGFIVGPFSGQKEFWQVGSGGWDSLGLIVDNYDETLNISEERKKSSN